MEDAGERVAHIAYGKKRLPLRMDPAIAEWSVVTPVTEAGLSDPHDAFLKICRHPIGSAPLADIAQRDDRVTIVTSDGTRALPNDILIPWLLDCLPVPDENVTILLGNGTHRANTPDEIVEMFGKAVVKRVRIENHNAFDPSQLAVVGHTHDGAPIALNKAYVEADKRFAVGFIEPHFFAGFSGGGKAVAPGVAGIESIFYLHSAQRIADEQADWAVLDGNPVQEAIVEMVAACPPDFLVNVTLNTEGELTEIFTGDWRAAHRAGCAHVCGHAMAPVPHAFDIIVTSNSGYPLDRNLYQTVKGMSAAARIVREGGTILVASECRDGIPADGHFANMLASHATNEALRAFLHGLTEPVCDQWQVQVLSKILARCRVLLFSALAEEEVQRCHLESVRSLQETLEETIRRLGGRPRVAVLPEGPLTIPYVKREGPHA